MSLRRFRLIKFNSIKLCYYYVFLTMSHVFIMHLNKIENVIGFTRKLNDLKL